MGRFLNADAFASTGQGILGNNIFAYCGNNPVNCSDPSGEAHTDIFAVCYGEDVLRDITEKLNKAMVEHAEELYFVHQTFGYLAAAVYFKDKVKTGGDWDLKNQPEWNLRRGQKYIYDGTIISFDDPGNIHYGFVGYDFFPEEILLLVAGLYQIKSGTSRWSYWATCFDDPRDYAAIARGIQLIMVKWNSAAGRGVLDGVIRGVFFYILGELVASIYLASHFRISMLLSCVFAVLVNVIFYMLNRGTVRQSVMAYVIGEIVFVLCAFLSFFNDIELHFHILPQGEMYYGDAMNLFFAVSVYTLFSGLLRLLLVILKCFISLVNKK